MSTIFGHGRLRLYLLKLLDESPRHGYEIISLLRDRFLGVYSPSPGTIYPRLARLEEEGLVTHEEVNGRKIYRLTDKGREELRNRSADLEDLERELTDSVRDIARAVKEDVRDTISSLREELKYLAGGTRRQGKGRADQERPSATAEEGDVWERASQETRDGSEEWAGESRHRNWWDREWERLAHGISTWGATWPRDREQPSELERTLRDFSDRVRGMVRDAGHISASTTENLSRILDDTVEAIRRDLKSWGPPEEGTAEKKPDGGTAEDGPSEKGPSAEPGSERRE